MFNSRPRQARGGRPAFSTERTKPRVEMATILELNWRPPNSPSKVTTINVLPVLSANRLMVGGRRPHGEPTRTARTPNY